MSGRQNDAAEPLLTFEHDSTSGHVVAEARLNSEATMNALSLPMIDILRPALERWRADPRVVAVVLTGAGDRAFSAGGDIQALYHAMVRNHAAAAAVDDYPVRFFEHEYRLDFELHTYPKPVISVGHGVVMGGGLGVFTGARYRLVTGRSRVAMPEITIGLFPDAGATWLLRGMPTHYATFLAVTGANMNATEALETGVATHAVEADGRGDVLRSLLGLDWRGNPGADHDAVASCLQGLDSREDLPESRLRDVPESLGPEGAPVDVAGRIRRLAGRSDWIDQAIAAMDRGCPTSVGLVCRQLQEAPGLDLAGCFRLEMVVATHCAQHPDFVEGVRALIIDKDNHPAWRYPDLASLPESYVAEHFVPPWPQNPLADLQEAGQ